MPQQLSAPPVQTTLVNRNQDPATKLDAYYIDPIWYRWFVESLIVRVESAPQVPISVSLEDQNASIATTALPLGQVFAGLYRVSWYFRVTQAATLNSALQVTISFTESGLPLSMSGANETGNTTSTVQSGSFLIRTDGASPISYATTYASVGGTPMLYRLDVVPEFVV